MNRFAYEAFINREATHEVRVSGANRESSAASPYERDDNLHLIHDLRRRVNTFDSATILSSFALYTTMKSLYILEQDVRDTCNRLFMFVSPFSYTAA